MRIGRAVDKLQCEQGTPDVTGRELLLVAPEGYQGPLLVCVNPAAAKPGQRVLVTRTAQGAQPFSPDAAVVGVLEE